MIVGVPREVLQEERRVALTPVQVERLIRSGAAVRVERGAGTAAGYPDAAFETSGASLGDASYAYGADVVVKVKCPLPREFAFLRANRILFSYLHFDGNTSEADVSAMVRTGVTAVAYEWVEDGGRLPLLEPMSRLSGVLFARRAMELLLHHRGHVGGEYMDGTMPARAMVIGLGQIGMFAAQVLARNGCRLLLVDKHPDTIDRRMTACWKHWDAGCVEDVIAFEESDPAKAVTRIRRELPDTDIVISGAVRRPSLPRARCRFLLDRAALRTMKPGSVLCDAVANIRDFFETCVPTPGLFETYIEEGVLHYNCDHISSLAAHTASDLLSRATAPYVLALAKGLAPAIQAMPSLAGGVMCRGGALTHRVSAENKGLPWKPLEDVMGTDGGR